MPRALLWFAYEGPRFAGYARQLSPTLRTVEGALLDACVERGVAPDRAAVKLRSGSRTDRGVSARRNACTLDTVIPPDRVAATIGTTVPGLWPLSSLEVQPGFDSRRAVTRAYRYHLAMDLVPPGTTAAALEAAGAPFVGRHDFRAFARLEAGKDPMRTVQALSVTEGQGMFVIEVRGPSFLWRQVRRMVSAMLAVCRGETDVATLEAALVDPMSAPDLGQVAADPLTLWDVAYADIPPPRAEGAHLRRLEEGVASAWTGAWAQAATVRSLLE